MIDWTKGYDTTWRVSPVDPVTWASTGAFERVTEASYTADLSTDAIETASAKCAADLGAQAAYGWLRIEAMCRQGASSEHVVLCTMRFDGNGGSYRGGYRFDELNGYSALYPASEVESLPDGAWAQATANGAETAVSLVAPHTPAPVTADGSFRIEEGAVYDLDSTPLAAALSILPEGWTARPDAYGAVHFMPLPTVPAASYGTAERGMFGTESTVDSDGRITYRRQWGAGHRVGDVLALRLPALGLDGLYRIVRQNVTCGARITAEETVEAIGGE